ncbi:MAG: DUF4190 domain-containing protein [Bacteroidota bacterium]|nr:DUF4190 domain-containing protein [Bacteroidota bacterium]
MKKFASSLIILFIVATITNCTVQKRSYRKGYYVSWNKKASPVLKVAKQVDAKQLEEKSTLSKIQIIKYSNVQEPLYVSANKSNNAEVKSLSIKPLTLINDSCADIITMRDGSDIEGKVIEVSSKLIKYKRCNNLNGPTIVASIESVFMIKYANGTKEVFKSEEVKNEKPQEFYVQPIEQKPIVKKKYNDFAIASIATFILYFTIILAPLPFIFGLIALHQIKKNPYEYKGKGMATIAVIPGFVALFILFLLLVAIVL